MQISVKIRGVTALLMNRFTEASEVSVSGGTSTTLRGDRGMPREQAALKRYCDEDGRLFIPGPNIFSAIVQAGAFHKAGKSKLTTMKSSLVPAGLSVSDLICPLLDDAGKPLKAWEVDSRSVVIPSTGGIRALFDDAGKKIGLGDYRPARKGPFGRFVVDQWREELAALAHESRARRG
jgi:hypothetical protein